MFGIRKAVFALFMLATVTLVNAIDLTKSPWIWTTEGSILATRAFRKTHVPPPGKTALFADIMVTADNTYAFYVNGILIGRRDNDNWQAAGRYCVGLRPGSNYFAVSVQNTSNIAGLEFAAIVYYDDGTSSTFVSDTAWRTLVGSSPPSGWEQPTFSDSAWQYAVVTLPYAAYPYAPITVPSGAKVCTSFPTCGVCA